MGGTTRDWAAITRQARAWSAEGCWISLVWAISFQAHECRRMVDTMRRGSHVAACHFGFSQANKSVPRLTSRSDVFAWDGISADSRSQLRQQLVPSAGKLPPAKARSANCRSCMERVDEQAA